MTSTTSESILLCSPPTTTTTTTTSTIKMTTRNHQGTNTASHFTVFIRLPFPRGDFVDPQPAEWNASKDRALWDVLSRPSKGDDVDWKALADSFDVTLEFLLQQAAWLYDRQLSKVRAQMRRVGTTTNTKAHPNASSPASGPGSVSGSTALEGQSTMKTAPGSRVPSRLTMRQADTHSQRAPQRTDSTTSVNAIKAPRDSSRNATPTVEKKEPKWESFNHHRSSSRRKQTVPTAPAHLRSPLLEEEDDDLSPSSSESESEDEEDEEKEPDVSGPRYRHFGKFSTYRPDLMPDDEEDEEDSPAFLPMSHEERLAPAPAPAPASREDPGQDLNATLRLNAEPRTMSRRHTAERVPATRKSLTTTESSTSSTSTGAVAISGSQTEHARRASQAPTVLSPKRTAELARRSSRRSNTSGRDTSDGTPSMGSSFSDLDDASVSQSALEEALMSNMQQGGMASRMSTISQALRSRYIG